MRYYCSMQQLSFSEPYLQALHMKSGKDIFITQPTIIFNASLNPVTIGTKAISSRNSSIFKHVCISTAEDVTLIASDNGFSALNQYPKREELMKKWTHVHDIFPFPHLKNTNLWRSPKQRIGNTAYNLWFAAEDTDCGMHNEHDFLEVHTQIWGTGHMQKFHEHDVTTMYEDISMTPGFTHLPFCNEHDHVYPWHRYYADTDCIRLAVEYSK